MYKLLSGDCDSLEAEIASQSFDSGIGACRGWMIRQTLRRRALRVCCRSARASSPAVQTDIGRD